MTITADQALYAPAWHADGNCADLADDTMYPVKGDATGESIAKNYCRACPVAADCLGESLANRDWFGIRAGLTGAERRTLAETREHRNCVGCGALFVPRLGNQKRCRTCSRTYRQAKR